MTSCLIFRVCFNRRPTCAYMRRTTLTVSSRAGTNVVLSAPKAVVLGGRGTHATAGPSCRIVGRHNGGHRSGSTAIRQGMACRLFPSGNDGRPRARGRGGFSKRAGGLGYFEGKNLVFDL